MLLNPNEYFVFGSNLAGVHGAGAAAFARMYFGAKLGVGEGITGSSYALPSKLTPSHALSWVQFEKHIDLFIKFAQDHPELLFWLSKVGTGLTKFKEEEVATYFAGGNLNAPKLLKNVYYPGTWLTKFYKKTFVRLVVAGSRSIVDEDYVFDQIDQMVRELKNQGVQDIIIVEGEAPGVDRLAKKYAIATGLKVRPMPANWDRYPHMAGFIRNQFQAMYGTHLLCLIENDSRGSKDMISRAGIEGLFTKIVRYERKT